MKGHTAGSTSFTHSTGAQGPQAAWCPISLLQKQAPAMAGDTSLSENCCPWVHLLFLPAPDEGQVSQWMAGPITMLLPKLDSNPVPPFQ